MRLRAADDYVNVNDYVVVHATVLGLASELGVDAAQLEGAASQAGRGAGP